ncbi:putative acyl-CoA thioesterase [Gemmatirosa kalamazoonensis]|uniref:Putative acyl-CoA thioesterase n=2 Tax=Gemmatirosa kalamazoonensis TaxID=861299 RepID=W0RP45_9BACT|nr:putative acyl-CoA thioesterase [Gemmatirosa kalamazoonensis]
MKILSGLGTRDSGLGFVSLLMLSAGACSRRDAGSTPSSDGASRAALESRVPSPEARPPLRVLFIGTSLTAGLGLDPDSAYPARVQRKADSAGIAIQAVNAGVSGETSAGALRRIDWVLREPADVVVLETGANDGLRALQVDSTRANLVAIVRRIRAKLPEARVVLVQMEAPPNLGQRYTAAFHAMFPDVARTEGVTLAPFLLQGVAGIGRLNQADGIHPNDAGERIVTETVWKAIEPALRAATAATAAGTG